MPYFPMQQNENNLFSDTIISAIHSVIDFDNNNVFIRYAEFDGLFVRVYAFVVAKSNGGIIATLDNSNTFSCYCDGDFPAQYTEYAFLTDGTYGGAFGLNENYFHNLPSSQYDTGASYLSNFNLKTSQGTLVLKFKDEASPDGDLFEITNMWTHGTWLNDTQPQVSGRPNYRNFRGKMTSGTFALFNYPVGEIQDGKLKMGITNGATFVDMEYSTDGINWVSTDTFPFNYFLRKRVNELGEFDYALTFANSKIPVFADETTAQGYIDGNVDITQAENWTDISQNYPIINNTANSDDDTEMGQVYTKSFFSQQYICSENAIQQISNALFDIDSGGATGIWDNIKRGLEMYGQNPIDAIQGCMYFPVNLSQVFQDTQNQSYIYFGGYKFDLTGGVSVDKIIHPNGYYDFGSFDLLSSFGGSWRDYSPYQRLFVFMPYIGWGELDIARYLGKHIDVKYYFDTRTGLCMACLFTQTSTGYTLVDYFQGQCGVSMPITLTDYASYMQTQLQTLLGVNSKQTYDTGVVGDFASGVGGGLIESGVMSPLGVASVGLAGAGVMGAVKTAYGLTQNNINNFNKTKGGSSSMLNQYLPQEVCFLLETQDATITPNELSLMGFPSNASGRLMDFSGYLEVDTVNLSCPYATENEKAEIVQMLKSGIYI